MIDYRNDIIDILRREYIGPDPVEGECQENGEEMLLMETPTMKYSAAILFPRKEPEPQIAEADIAHEQEEGVSTSDESEDVTELIERVEDISSNISPERTQTYNLSADVEDPINLSNAFRQSAVSLTIKLSPDAKQLTINVAAGIYNKVNFTDARENRRTSYAREQISDTVDIVVNQLPVKRRQSKHFSILEKRSNNLKIIITNRETPDSDTCGMYTVSLVNENFAGNGKSLDENCYFQVEMKVVSDVPLLPVPEARHTDSKDEDYQSNLLLYRDVKTYATGHGCAAKWNQYDVVIREVSTTFMPEYEVRPIEPVTSKALDLDMFLMSDLGNRDEALTILDALCGEYENWIKKTDREAPNIREYAKYKATIDRHMKSCNDCLRRMKDGIILLKSDPVAYRAFSYMNRAMLLQQLHYGMPLQKWIEIEDGGRLDGPVAMPDINDKASWFDNAASGGGKIYGKWRAFQIAFILLNVNSMYKADHPEREIVDLIWFPTGGGKTEAYLGLSAFTIFLRRLRNKEDTGTTVMMRYTLRLLTTQQYERASSLICACDLMRQEKESELGSNRISIGLWVGDKLTPNKMETAVAAFNKLQKNEGSEDNPFIILKCPWCGAEMGAVPIEGKAKESRIFGYKKTRSKSGKNEIIFRCGNPVCEFYSLPLPLYVVDSAIYASPPTMLIGTVDKFAMLSYNPAARSLFGKLPDNTVSPPELIIQDELHLISGPLGSMVGHYEMLIHELCAREAGGQTTYPKVIGSTATISRAKDQCNALYGVDKEKVNQFPAPGTSATDSFFARENNDPDVPGRRYLGLCAPAASSFSMSIIRLYATLLFAAKELPVVEEKERDAYWTNLGYFNSLRELGQTATWISADIPEHLHSIYLRKKRDKNPDYKQKRRYIYKYEELTSRISNTEIPASMKRLETPYDPPYGSGSGEQARRPVDICLATNMVSVGVDIQRLALMTVDGQPKTTSEYIQATSRVGRGKAPGLVITVYNSSKARDKSHYEHFQTYHSKLYCSVEPTSVTPFSSPLRKRALKGVLVGFARQLGRQEDAHNSRVVPDGAFLRRIESVIERRVVAVDPEELVNTKRQLQKAIEQWNNNRPGAYDSFTCGDQVPLIYAAGMPTRPSWEGVSWPVQTSMRNVDSSCVVKKLNGYFVTSDGEGEDDDE